MMRRETVAIVGAAETTQLGIIPDMSQIQLHADAALNALADAQLKPSDIDGVACVNESPAAIAHYLGIQPTWVDGTNVGGCSNILHIRHAAAAISAGLCSVVLVVHGESGRSRVGVAPWVLERHALYGQFEMPYSHVYAPSVVFTLPFMRYMRRYGLTEEQFAYVAVVQREWASRNPRALHRQPLTVDDVLNSKLIAYPFHRLHCCVVTDGGGALIVTSADRAAAFPTKPVYVWGTGESTELPMMLISQMEDFTSSRAFRVSGAAAFAESGITQKDVDHLMIYDAFAHVPLYGLEDLGFVGRGEAGPFIWEGNTAYGGKLPMNTNGGGLSYTHTGMYGMYALQESVRQMRGTAAAQVEGAKISLCHGVGGMFSASSTAIVSNERRS